MAAGKKTAKRSSRGKKAGVKKKSLNRKAAEQEAAKTIRKCRICTRPAKKWSNYCSAHPPGLRSIGFGIKKKAAKRKAAKKAARRR